LAIRGRERSDIKVSGPMLVIVEVTSGCGKSSTAQTLSIQFAKNGYRSRWLYEGESENPVKDWYDPDKHSAPDIYRANIISAWKKFICEINSDSIIHCLDGCLFQSTIFGLLQHGIDECYILALVQEILKLLQETEAVLIYLRSEDIEQTMKAACHSRYDSLMNEYIIGIEKSLFCKTRGLRVIDGLICFWAEIQKLSEQLLNSFSGRKTIINVSRRNWNERYKFLSKYFELLTFSSEQMPDIDLMKYAGRYSRKIKDRCSEFEVRCEHGYLVVVGLGPYLWSSGNRLIPLRENVFCAQSWPTEVVFEPNSDGTIKNLHLTTRDRGWRKTDEVFPKLS
jgi:hypothetical protein